MRIDRLLQSQGFGTRASCQSLIRGGAVCVAGQTCVDPSAEFELDDLEFSVNDQIWCYRRQAYLVMHKPSFFECSHRPSHYPSIYSLLPRQLIARGIQAVGRLDADTTGLILFSDDGQFIHRYTSPKKTIEKFYEAKTAHPITEEQITALMAGVVLHDDPRPVRAVSCTTIDPSLLGMVITEGKYHLVKRMIAAAGNHVEALHRSKVCDYALPADLAPGEWRWLSSEDLALLGWGDSVCR